MWKQWNQWQTLFWGGGGGSKITADGDCSHEIKRCLLLGRKVMTNLDNVLKSREITLPTKVHLVKAMVFLVVMYGCESWTIKTKSFEKTLMLGRMKAGGEGNNRGWDGWMASLTQRTWVWVNSRSWWWTGRPGVLRFMGSQSRTRLRDWTELMKYMVSSHSSSKCLLKLKLKAQLTKTKTSYHFYWKVPMSKTSSPRKWAP